jgi:hypothetical protein
LSRLPHPAGGGERGGGVGDLGEWNPLKEGAPPRNKEQVYIVA